MQVDAIIFDFDGIILESVAVKTEAFRTLFSFTPEHVDEIVDFHLKNGGMSRFDKFRYIYKNILMEDLTDEKFRWLSDRFTELVLEGVLNAPYVQGAKEFIELYHNVIPLYVVSATPQDELVYIVQQKGLAKYFRGVYGSPVSKEEHIKRIVRNSHVDPSLVVYIGDAVNDWHSARAAGVRFIARVRPGDVDRFEGLSDVEMVIHDLHDLAGYIRGGPC